MTNTSKILARIERAELELEEAKKALKFEEDNQWPQEGDPFYFVSYCGSVETSLYSNSYSFLQDCGEIGNVFKTKEEAETRRDALLLTEKLRRAAKESWGDRDPVWDSRTPQYTVFYTDSWKVNCWHKVQNLGAHHFASQESAQQFIDENKDNLHLLLN